VRTVGNASRSWRRGDCWAGVAGAAPSGSIPGSARSAVRRVAAGLASEVEAGACAASLRMMDKMSSFSDDIIAGDNTATGI